MPQTAQLHRITVAKSLSVSYGAGLIHLTGEDLAQNTELESGPAVIPQASFIRRLIFFNRDLKTSAWPTIYEPDAMREREKKFKTVSFNTTCSFHSKHNDNQLQSSSGSGNQRQVLQMMRRVCLDYLSRIAGRIHSPVPDSSIAAVPAGQAPAQRRSRSIWVRMEEPLQLRGGKRASHAVFTP
ncbi:hypothetical protein MHYP_G00109630 [Metynnis hypsauchen]